MVLWMKDFDDPHTNDLVEIDVKNGIVDSRSGQCPLTVIFVTDRIPEDVLVKDRALDGLCR